MTEEELILKNIPLIYIRIKEMNCYWKNDDEFQDLYDAGLEGLINGAKTFNPDLGYKPSTYLGKCIKNEISNYMRTMNYEKRRIYKNYVRSLDDYVKEGSDDTFKDFIVDLSVNIEEELEKKLEIERLMYAVDKLKNKTDRLFLCEFYGIKGYKKISGKELQKKYNVSHNMTQIRLKRAKTRIKEYLEKHKAEAFMQESKEKK